VAHADKVLDLASNRSPTVYSMDIGFAAAADVYFELWENSRQDPGRHLDADKHKLSAQKAMKLLRAFQKVFPIGESVTLYYQGWHDWLSDNYEKAIISLYNGMEAAQKFNMPYEEGLIRVRLASYAQDNSDTRKKHVQRAIEIFEKMGAIHELKLAQEQAQKTGI
jgi:tetratricopeptide (TPR) repeat protein